MNATDFTYLLQNPQAITDAQTEAVKSIISQYPYMQSARAIYLKGLKNLNSLDYNNELKITAAHTSDRSILFDYITSDTFIQNEISHIIKQNTAHLKDIEVDVEPVLVDKSVAIGEALKKQIQETEGVLDPLLFSPKIPRIKPVTTFELDQSQAIEEVTKETKTQEVSEADILQLGQPLPFDRTEKHSFNEWLKLTRFKPVERNETATKTTEKPVVEAVSVDQSHPVSDEKEKKFELINKFIQENPKILPSKSYTPKGNLAEEQMIKPEALMTETLARIYVEQKNYKKAIQSYKILSLKYPEKSSFFANQIKAVEQLQEQNK